MNEPVIPFKNEGIFVLNEIRKRILDHGDSAYLGQQEWVEIYKNTYNEVLTYVNNGVIPRGGFSLGIEAFGSIFYHPVLEAHRYRAAMPVGTLEAFYAICTSSAHVTEIRSKVTYNDAVFFDRALSHDHKSWLRNIDPIHLDRFKGYIVERGSSLNMPFNIAIPHYDYGVANPIVIGNDLDSESITRKIHAAVLDVYKYIPTEVHKKFGKNVRLDVFLLDNKLQYFDCINTIQQLLNRVELSDQRKLEAAEVLWGNSNSEWNIPNCRLTVRDHQRMVECYLTIRFIPLPSFVDMITLRAKSLCRFLDHMQHSLILPEPRVLIDYLKQDLDYVCDYRNESLGIHREIDLHKYYHFMGERGFKGYGQNLNLCVLHGAYQLLETYNHHLTLNFLTPLPPIKSKMSDAQKLNELQEHIYNSLASFGKSRTNYSFQLENNKWEFKGEVEITEKLVTYLENSKEYTVQGESPESSGKVDIKIGFKHSNIEPVMIEVKLLRAANDKKMPTPSDILRRFKSAVSQLSEYTRHTDAKGMLLFFTLDLNEGQVAQVIEDNLHEDDYEFIKLHKSRIKNRITHIVKTTEAEYLVRFMKLTSTTPSKG